MFSPPFESKSCYRVSPAPPLSTGPRRPMASVYEAGPLYLQKPQVPQRYKWRRPRRNSRSVFWVCPGPPSPPHPAAPWPLSMRLALFAYRSPKCPINIGPELLNS